MRRKTTIFLILLLFLCPVLTGCRVRTTVSGQQDPAGGSSAAFHNPEPGSFPDSEADPADSSDEQKKNEEAAGKTKENPDSSRKEYDENAPAEIVPGTEQTLHRLCLPLPTAVPMKRI